MRDPSWRLARLTAQLGGCAVHRGPVVCPDCDVEIDPLSKADEEELRQLLYRIRIDTRRGPPHPPCPGCGGARLCLSCDTACADTTLVDDLTREEHGRLVDLLVQQQMRIRPEVRHGGCGAPDQDMRRARDPATCAGARVGPLAQRDGGHSGHRSAHAPRAGGGLAGWRDHREESIAVWLDVLQAVWAEERQRT
jgi:hypothetical protein